MGKIVKGAKEITKVMPYGSKKLVKIVMGGKILTFQADKPLVLHTMGASWAQTIEGAMLMRQAYFSSQTHNGVVNERQIGNYENYTTWSGTSKTANIDVVAPMSKTWRKIEIDINIAAANFDIYDHSTWAEMNNFTVGGNRATEARQYTLTANISDGKITSYSLIEKKVWVNSYPHIQQIFINKVVDTYLNIYALNTARTDIDYNNYLSIGFVGMIGKDKISFTILNKTNSHNETEGYSLAGIRVYT